MEQENSKFPFIGHVAPKYHTRKYFAIHLGRGEYPACLSSF